MIRSVVAGGRRVMSRQRSVRGLILLLILSVLGCAPKLVGPTDPSGYYVVVPSRTTIYTGSNEVVVVRVQDAGGQKVDGVAVAFQVDPAWEDIASVAPARVTTSRGRARTVFRASTTGVIPVTVQVENTTHVFKISAMARSRGGTGGGG